MAKMILTSTILLLNAVDRSTWVARCELAVEAEAKDVTVFASGGFKENLSGLKSGNLAIMFDNDVATAQLDETMWTLFIASAPVTFEVRAASAVVGVSNPKYTGNIVITGWTPISGSPGDVNQFTVTYPTTGPVARATS
jgi:hypothetical protein